MMKTILFALMASMAVAFAPVPVATRTQTSLNGAPEAALQVLGWIGFMGIAANLVERNAEKIAGNAPAPSAAAPAAAASGDISIPYDAAAQLAYSKAGSPGDYAAFKAKYEADAVADVIKKQK